MRPLYVPPTAKGSALMMLFNKAARKKGGITNLKLQKLLYYIHGWSMTLEKKNHFGVNKFQAWQLGPVHQGFYHQFKHFGSQPIKIQFPEFEETDFLISLIVEIYSALTESEIVDLTHREQPWLQNWNESKFQIIPDVEIVAFFSDETLMKEKIHKVFLEEYLHRKDSFPANEVFDASPSKLPERSWDFLQ